MKHSHPNYLKHLLQWGVLGTIIFTIVWRRFTNQAIDVEAYCPFGGLQALTTFLKSNTLACSMSMSQIMMGVALAVGVILFAKLFCGYLCPLGTVSERLHLVGKRLRCSVEVRPDSSLDHILRAIKYLLLFTIFYYTISSSELFCKRFDPYYAIATGFKGESVAWLSTISVGALFLGSIFIKMFWCRYICPLGALSNSFKFTYLVAGVLLGSWGLSTLGIEQGWIWMLGALCSGGYLLEILHRKSPKLTLIAVNRNSLECNNCMRCNSSCPYSIPVSKLSSVKHIDCTLCGECISACATGALQFNSQKNLRWLPAFFALTLMLSALWLGNRVEIPTINEQWGEPHAVSELRSFSIKGLQSIKCFGSSKALSARLQSVEGIYGLKCYVRGHSVEILYDPKQIDERKLQELLFSPETHKYRNPEEGVELLQLYELGIEGLRDKSDMQDLRVLLQTHRAIYGFSSEFDCPVRVKLYVSPTESLNQESLRALIEMRSVIYNGKQYEINADLELISYSEPKKISRSQFLNIMFESISSLSGRFKRSNELWGDEELYPQATYEISLRNFNQHTLQSALPYFKGFLTTLDGILAVEFTLCNEEPLLRLTYVEQMWDSDRLYREVFQAPTWQVRMTSGALREMPSKIHFKEPGRVISKWEIPPRSRRYPPHSFFRVSPLT